MIYGKSLKEDGLALESFREQMGPKKLQEDLAAAQRRSKKAEAYAKVACAVSVLLILSVLCTRVPAASPAREDGTPVPAASYPVPESPLPEDGTPVPAACPVPEDGNAAQGASPVPEDGMRGK